VPKITPGWRELDVFGDAVPLSRPLETPRDRRDREREVKRAAKEKKRERNKGLKDVATSSPQGNAMDLLRQQARELDGMLLGKREQELREERARLRQQAVDEVTKDRLLVAKQLNRQILLPPPAEETVRQRRQREWKSAESILDNLELEARRRAAVDASRPLDALRESLAAPQGTDEGDSASEGGIGVAELTPEPAREAARRAAVVRAAQAAANKLAAQRAASAGPTPSTIARDIMEAFDQDRDGKLCFGEFRTMCRALSGCPADAPDEQARVPPREKFTADFGQGASVFAVEALLKRQSAQGLRKTFNMLETYRERRT